MEKTVKVSIDIRIARDMLGLAGFWKLAETGTDEEIFDKVLDMMTSYGTKTEIVEDAISPDAIGLPTAMAVLSEPVEPRAADGSAGFASMFPEFDEEVCNNKCSILGGAE